MVGPYEPIRIVLFELKNLVFTGIPVNSTLNVGVPKLENWIWRHNDPNV